MKAILLFIVLFTIANFAKAQNSFADKAREQMQYGAYARASDSWSRALSQDGNNDSYLFQRGLCNLKLNRIDNAHSDFNKAAEIAPENAEYAYYEGTALFAKESYQQAKPALEKACKLAPQNVDYFLQKAMNLEQVANSRAVIEDCRKILRTDNPNPEILIFRATMYQKQGDLELADRDLKQALKANAESGRFYALLGDYYRNEQNYAQAIASYAKAHELDKTNMKYLFQEADLLLHTGSHRSSLERATKLMQMPNARLLFTKGYILRATSAVLLRDVAIYEKCIRDFTAVAKTESEYAFAAKTLYMLEAEHADGLEQAKMWAIKATGFTDNFQNNLLLAQIYFKLDATTQALEIAKKAKTIIDANKKGFENEKKEINALITQIEISNSDKTPPVLTILSPMVSRGGIVIEDESEIIIVVGLAKDESGITKILINGNIAKIESDGHFEGKTTLKGAQTRVLIQAFDKRGNVGETFFDIEKKKAPAILVENKNTETAKPTIGKCHALLIGNNSYKHWSQLYNPIHDAKTLAKDLEQIYGFTTEIIENCNQEDFELKIREYVEKEYAENDQLLIFYAGHGHFDHTTNRGALVMTDSEHKGKTLKSYITHENLRSLISAIPCKHTLYIADACFGGTIDRTIEASRGAKDDNFKANQNYINRIMTYETRRYITSGGKEYVPDGKPGGHSPFMRKLLAVIRSEGGKDGILTLEEIEEYMVEIKPVPIFGELDQNEVGSNFLFIKK